MMLPESFKIRILIFTRSRGAPADPLDRRYSFSVQNKQQFLSFIVGMFTIGQIVLICCDLSPYKQQVWNYNLRKCIKGDVFRINQCLGSSKVALAQELPYYYTVASCMTRENYLSQACKESLSKASFALYDNLSQWQRKFTVERFRKQIIKVWEDGSMIIILIFGYCV